MSGSRPPSMEAYFSCIRRYADSAVASVGFPTNSTPQGSGGGLIVSTSARATRPTICVQVTVFATCFASVHCSAGPLLRRSAGYDAHLGACLPRPVRAGRRASRAPGQTRHCRHLREPEISEFARGSRFFLTRGAPRLNGGLGPLQTLSRVASSASADPRRTQRTASVPSQSSSETSSAGGDE